MKELIALAKANPGKLNYASVGTGSPGHIAGELLKLKTGIDMVHIPYKGGGPAVIDTIGGQVQLAVRLDAGGMAAREGGQAEGDRRRQRASAAVAAPDLPTIAESGVPDYVGRLVVRRARAGEDAAGRRREAQRGIGQGARESGDQGEASRAGRRGGAVYAGRIRALIKDELAKWDYVIETANIRPE